MIPRLKRPTSQGTGTRVGIEPLDYEANIELRYHAPINEWLTVQPYIQYAIQTGSDPLPETDPIVGVRFEFGYRTGFDSLRETARDARLMVGKSTTATSGRA